MEDKGQKLYEMYAAAYARANVGIESWHEMDELDKNVWREMANNIMEGGL